MSIDADFRAWLRKLDQLSHNLLGPVSQRADTSDLKQEVALQVVRQGKDFLSVNPGYLAAAAKGHAAKMTLFHVRQRRSVLRETELFEQPGKDLPPDVILQRREALEGLAKAVASLAESEQRLIYLRTHLGYSYARIAEEVDQTERVVQLSFQTAMNTLRQLLGGQNAG